MPARWPSAPAGTNRQLYTEHNPLGGVDFEAKIKLLDEIDAYARAKDRRVRQVMASLTGRLAGDRDPARRRPPSRRHPPAGPAQRLGRGRRRTAAWRPAATAPAAAAATSTISTRTTGRAQVDEALRQALVNLGSVPAPAGEMTVVLGPGWPGILLHEAIGHGLEGDFNRKKTSAFAGLLGERVAAGRDGGR